MLGLKERLGPEAIHGGYLMKRTFIFLAIALIAVLPLAAKGNNTHILVGAEAGIEDNASAFAVGPWGDINVSSGKVLFEAYLGWMPYIEEPNVGYLFGELDLYYKAKLNKNAVLTPAVCVSDKLYLDPILNAVNVEPSLKLDVKNFFVKLCVPLQVLPEFEPYAYIEPGIHVRNLTLKLRGAVGIDPFEFAYARWWADLLFKKGDVYAYGTIREVAGEVVYNQYLGFYIGLK